MFHPNNHSHMKSFLISLFILMLASPVVAQHAGNVRYNQHQQTLEGIPATPIISNRLPSINPYVYEFEVNGLSNVVADGYLAVFNLVQVAPDALEADEIVSNRIANLVEGLAELGIERGDVTVDMVSQVPVYAIEVEKKLFSKDTYQEVPVGIELQKNILIYFTEAGQLDAILTAAARSEIYDLVKVDYYVSDREAVYRELRDRCKKYLDEQVSYYQSLGIRLDTAARALSFTQSVIYPMSRYRDYQASSVSRLKGVTSNSGVEQVRKPRTMYYHAFPDQAFQVVINPEIREPVVQYTYSLRVRFTFNQPAAPQVRTEVQRQREYIILTPDGQTRTLELRNED